MKKLFFALILSIFFNNLTYAQEINMLLKLKYGDVIIELFPDFAPNHVKRFTLLVEEKMYDGVVFHRVIENFMAQTGDVQYGNSLKADFNLRLAGTGGSKYPDLKEEFSNLPHEAGTLSMARSNDPNSANSQFFICFQSQPHLDRNYTVIGKVVKGMEFVNKIKKGEGPNGSLSNPDIIISLRKLK